MISLAAAAVFFLAVHILVPGTALRGRLVGLLGAPAYQGLFSVVSILGIAWLAWAYNQAAYGPFLWGELPGSRHLAMTLMLPVFILFFSGLMTRNPTAVGQEATLERAEPARGVLRITRHPFMWSVVAWSVLHLLANGDGASLILFGTMLVLALWGPLLIDRRRAATHGAAWQRFAAITSNVPFAAILGGRNRLALGEIAWWHWLGGIALWALVLLFHGDILGVPVIDRGALF
ncbi:NnrU family protein [Zavarzinia sp. CC-PAN008]|uniref:NnrU family protein n=1 Tax=Zavarzinia sp. CC-PAN008 TaxID=3243332 RepID=UPI003F745B8A